MSFHWLVSWYTKLLSQFPYSVIDQPLNYYKFEEKIEENDWRKTRKPSKHSSYKIVYLTNNFPLL